MNVVTSKDHLILSRLRFPALFLLIIVRNDSFKNLFEATSTHIKLSNQNISTKFNVSNIFPLYKRNGLKRSPDMPAFSVHYLQDVSIIFYPSSCSYLRHNLSYLQVSRHKQTETTNSFFPNKRYNSIMAIFSNFIYSMTTIIKYHSLLTPINIANF